MKSVAGAIFCCVIVLLLSSSSVHLLTIRSLRQNEKLTFEPTEAIVYPGDNVTFVCSSVTNSTIQWSVTSTIHEFDIQETIAPEKNPGIERRSAITIYSVSRLMSGEIECSTEDGMKAIGFLLVNGVRNGGPCRATNDCITGMAVCRNSTCQCPKNHIQLRVKDKGYDVCREISGIRFRTDSSSGRAYSLYDPCEYDEQCSHLVDPKSICKQVCVCAPWARDRKGKCISMSEVSYNKSQEMYRVGLIAVTCIIILIVAVSLWVTLKRTCREHNSDGHRRSITQMTNLSSRSSYDISMDKPPSYDDVLVVEDTIAEPPNIKEALKHCMTAKKLTRQVSAPAGQLMVQAISQNPSYKIKPFQEG